MALNPIIAENLKPGTAREIWDAPASNQIEGFATDFSVDQGEGVTFKINVNAAEGVEVPYTIEIYRLGYYGGDGATLVTTLDGLTGTAQPDPITDERGLVDAGNWAASAQWLTPEDAVSGVYLAKLVRADNGETNQIPFIVREDALRSDGTRSDIVLQTSDTTWQAYNGWAGNNSQVGGNFYGGFPSEDPGLPDPSPLGVDRAYAVSYNRPMITRDGGGFAAGAQDYLFGADYAAIYWLEKQGYDVSYISGVDTDRLGVDALLGHKSFLSVGHDEYWSGDQRDNVEAARDAGVNLQFWGGNDMYWKTRWETSIDGNGTEYRTLVSYKETWANYSLGAQPEDYANLDPANEWTGTWRDLRFVESVDAQGNLIASGAEPEHALIGTAFKGDGATVDDVGVDVPAELAGLRFWRDTTVADGGVTNLAPGIIGYEWNNVPDDEFRPAGLIELSNTLVDWPELLIDQGSRTVPGTDTHALTLYRAPSGALVFSAGTVFWTWGLSDEHDSSPYGVLVENLALKQFTINMFADMGIQPGVSDAILASRGLVRAEASTDTVAASITLDNIPDEVLAFQTYVISGTATDDDGDPLTDDGQVAMVEVSFDDGATWRPAEGRANWTYSWTPVVADTYTIRARAIDDSLNLPVNTGLPSDIVTVTTPPLPDSFSLFDGTPVAEAPISDAAALELGVRFEVAQTGVVTELSYWRAAGDADDTDVRSGHLWGPAGNLLATVTFNSAPGAVGWQTVALSTPVTVTAGQTYTASYKTLDNYVASAGFFAFDYSEPFNQLSVPATIGGVYRYGADLAVPTQSFQESNYWVDLTYEIGAPGNTAPVITSGTAFSTVENGFTAATIVAQDGQNDVLTYSIAGGVDAARFNIDATSGVLSFVDRPDFELPADTGGDNIYDVTVAVSDGIAPAVTQDIQITVTDQDPESPPNPLDSLFNETPVSAPLLNDGQALELGVEFEATQAGVITEVRYYRAAGDAGDTDVRAAHLWNAAGTLLATGQFISAPGETGWQTATFASPVLIQAGQTYTASYRTDDNYLGSSGFFGTNYTNASGVLSADAITNGVYRYGADLAAPTSSFNATNYWVDLGFEPGVVPSNEAPVLTSANAFSALENQTLAGTITATDADNNLLTYSIAGGVDAARFNIDATSGVLSFVDRPDFELPADTGGDNIYDVTVAVSDGIAPAVTQDIQITVTDEDPEAPPLSFATLFAETDTPATTITTDPTVYELGVQFSATTEGEVSDLRYFRSTPDASDTDVRVLNLWDSNGNRLATTTVQSDPGDTGWQIGALSAPVTLTPGSDYVVSYGTTENYVATSFFFQSDYTGPDGLLEAGGGNNGLFAAGLTDVFPTQSYQSTNYWVDVGFDVTPLAALSALLQNAPLVDELVF
ncbi:Cadherin domain-containing protein [Jannaschia faecimaris]|uniref:Cadherin domain-containing protein n=1 Tax=Jannaschia faecimaris TaxID=1244108 RepID=A0A1H3JCJ0_9RHOB|nr:DUF4082 domain-containing protein [Jannaschia faecimaris]SDY36924.1 Cadherin domain-containing protein [Jannaschia faecimaris]